MKQIKKYTIILLMIIFANLMLFINVNADEKTVRVGCVDIENFLTQSSNGTVYGYGADYLEELSKYTDWKYEYVKGTWYQCTKWLREGKIDLIFPAEKDKERDKKYGFSNIECCIDYITLLTNKNNDVLYYEDYKGFTNIKVGMIKGNYLNKEFKKFAKEKEFKYRPSYYKNYNEMNNALHNNKIDAIVMGNLTRGEDKKILAKFGYYPAYFMTNIKDKKFLKELNQAIYSIMLQNPYFTSKLIEKYYGSTEKMAQGYTKEEEEYIDKSKELEVVCDENNYPFEWYDKESKTFKGANIDVLNTISKKSGLKFKYVYTNNLNESWNKIGKGDGDIISGVYVDMYLSDKYNINPTKNYMNESSQAIGRSDNPVTANSSLVVVVNSSLIGTQEYIRMNHPDWKIITRDTVDECLQLVCDRRADITFVDVLAMQTSDILSSRSDLTTLPNIAIELPVCLGVNKDCNPLLLSILNKTITLVSEEEIQEAIVKNTKVDESTMSLKNIIRYHPIASFLLVLFISIGVAVALVVIVRAHFKVKQAAMLEEKNRQLEFANKAKMDFLSRMSHDVRTPLNGIIGITELSALRDIPEDLKADLNKIDSSAKYLLSFVNDILEMAKIENKSDSLKLTAYPFKKLQEYIMAIIQPLCEKKGITFTIKADEMQDVVYFVDELRLNQILFNLLSNSIKFTEEHGNISFIVTNIIREDGYVSADYIIKDDGIGMEKEFQNHMFEPFVRENSLLSNPTDGIGLGLSTVKKYIELFNGEITVNSEKNIGTEIVIKLTIKETKENKEPEETKPKEYTDIKGKRILVCEDNELNREIIQRLLEKYGVIVECSNDGKQGVERFKECKANHFDAILMDIRMPVMDGLEAAKNIRTLDRDDAKGIPIIAITANAFDEDIRKYTSVGMNAYLAKPIDIHILYKTLSALLPNG